MNFIERFNLRPMTILKILGLIFVGLFLLIALLQFASSAFRGMNSSDGVLSQNSSLESNMNYKDMAMGSIGNAPQLSTRNVAKNIYKDKYTAGADAEDFEVTDYRGSIETRNIHETCSTIAQLKVKSYVIFENSNESDKNCNYTFKVKKENTEEILAIVKKLDPKTLNENTKTIKRQIEDFTSEVEILNRKKETIEKTLEDAVLSYDEISRVATQSRDAESLAKIIDSKIRIIERLTTERISISEQLDRLSRAKAEQLDKLEYTYFYLNVYENKYIDGNTLKDSWKATIKNFIRTSNKILQDLSINLALVVFYIVQYLVYIFIVLIALKLIWKFTKRIWKK